jgi:WD40 repeat protein
VGYDHQVWLWRVGASIVIRTFSHPSVVHCVAYSRDGTQLATALDDYTIRIWAA